MLAETHQDRLSLQQKLTNTHKDAAKSMLKTVKCIPSTNFN